LKGQQKDCDGIYDGIFVISIVVIIPEKAITTALRQGGPAFHYSSIPYGSSGKRP